MAENKIYSTLCYIEKNNCFLMLFRNKKKNDPCEGKWVGVGGKFEPGETADECLVREVREETGLHLTDYTFCGIVHFVSDTWPNEDMYLYTASGYEGNDQFRSFQDLKLNKTEETGGCPFDCDEGELCWIPVDQILDLNLWDGDRYFLGPLIEGEKDIHITCRYEGHKCVEVYINRRDL